MNPKIFKQYDIRGVWQQDWDVSDIPSIGQAIANFFHQHDPGLTTIILGLDLRSSSKLIAEHLTKKLALFYKIEVVGACPTPAISSWVKHRPNSAGIMVTASHNPNNYNGLKLYLNSLGGQVWGEQLMQLASLTQTQTLAANLPVKSNAEITTTGLVKEVYLQRLTEGLNISSNCSLKIGFDSLGGSAEGWMQDIIDRIGLTGAIICKNAGKEIQQPDPNHEPNLKALKSLIAEKQLDLGIAFDGDADRMLALDNTGKTISGDELIAIFATDLLQQFSGRSIVVDVKTSDLVLNAVQKHHGQIIYSATGNPFLQQKAAQHNAIFCGEASCHFSFFDRGPMVDDGIYSALRLIEILHRTKKSLGDLALPLTKTTFSPEITLEYSSLAMANNCLAQVEQQMKILGAKISNIDGIKARFEYGWGLIRKSNTQPLLSLRFEANSLGNMQQIQHYFKTSMAGLISTKELEKIIE